MSSMRDYIVDFKKLGEGEHKLKFRVDNTLFEEFKFDEINNCDIKILAELNVESSLISIVLKIKGSVNVQCDICSEFFDMPIKKKVNLYFRMTDEQIEDESEVIYIPTESETIDLKKHIFDYIVLSLPIKRVHPLDDKGNKTCNPEILKILNEHENRAKMNNIPGWGDLKNLFNN